MAGLFGSNSSFGMSSLFGNNSSSVLSDWAFIRSGTYKKLMKAYYGQDKTTKSATESAKTNKTKTTAERVRTEIETSATDLKKSTDALMATGTKSLFKTTETKGEDGKVTKTYDTDKIYKAVSRFVKDYNNLIDTTNKSSVSGVKNNVRSLTATTTGNETLLKAIGITVKADNKLSIDEDTFKKADMSKVEALFKGNTSYGYQVGLRTSLIDYYAGREADTYNKYGSYSTTNTGTNFNSWF